MVVPPKYYKHGVRHAYSYSYVIMTNMITLSTSIYHSVGLELPWTVLPNKEVSMKNCLKVVELVSERKRKKNQL